MPYPSGSSEPRSSHQQRNAAPGTSSAEMVEQVKEVVTQLYDVVASSPEEWATCLASARSAVAALDHIQFFRDPARFAEQAWILHGLQEYAFHDPDSGCIPDIAEFCQNSWLVILTNFPENVDILIGLGSNWFQRAQATIARISNEEGNDSSSQGSGPTSDPRRQGPLYVEARGYLQPAVDFYARAVRAADAEGSTTGEVLAAAAHSQISLANVTAAPGDERLFHQAVRSLRRAEDVPGYSLSIYLQRFLDEYGRYVN